MRQIYVLRSGRMEKIMCNRKGILVVSYGSSYKESREKSIGGIERTISEMFSEYKVYRAFTSESIIERIRKKEGIKIDTISQALERAISDGVREMLIIQTHLVRGNRYEDLVRTVEKYKSSFEYIKVAESIFDRWMNIEAFANVMRNLANDYDDGKTAICYVGHGIDEGSNKTYREIQEVLWTMGCKNYFVGTLSVNPTLEDVRLNIKEAKIYQRVIILPLMLVSGYHVRKDLTGPKTDSWKNVFLREGFEVECVKKGLGEIVEIQNIFAEHLKSVML